MSTTNDKGYYLGLTGNRVSELLHRHFIVPTLDDRPNKDTHNWNDGQHVVNFRIGELCRVLINNKWIFYRLQNINGAEYEWVEASSGSVHYVSIEEYDELKKQGLVSPSNIYMIMDEGQLVELRIGEILIGVKESANNGFPYYFPIVF